MPEFDLVIKFEYKQQSIYLVISNWLDLFRFIPKTKLGNLAIYQCKIVDYIYHLIYSKVREVANFEVLGNPPGFQENQYKFLFNIEGCKIGSFYSSSNSILGAFEYQFNPNSYLKLPQATQYPSNKCGVHIHTQYYPKNDSDRAILSLPFSNLSLPFRLIHGIARLGKPELNCLGVGDVIFFDDSYAPDQVVISVSNKFGVVCQLCEKAIVIKNLIFWD